MGWNHAFSLLARCNEVTEGGQTYTLRFAPIEVRLWALISTAWRSCHFNLRSILITVFFIVPSQKELALNDPVHQQVIPILNVDEYDNWVRIQMDGMPASATAFVRQWAAIRRGRMLGITDQTYGPRQEVISVFNSLSRQAIETSFNSPALPWRVSLAPICTKIGVISIICEKKLIGEEGTHCGVFLDRG